MNNQPPPLKVPVANTATGETDCVDLAKALHAETLRIDWDYMPGDRMTMASVLALDYLAEQGSSDDPSARMFSTLYALHLRAEDMAFSTLLKSESEPIAAMVAVALDAWTVRDPMLVTDVMKAREMLKEALGYEFKPLKYVPFWM